MFRFDLIIYMPTHVSCPDLIQSKTFSLLAVLATGASVVSAHGHVLSWTVNGVAMPGDNPSNSGEYGPTAQRPSDNRDQGEYHALRSKPVDSLPDLSGFVPDITAGRVACGGASAGSGLETYPVDAGSNVVATWDTWPESHKGMYCTPSGLFVSRSHMVLTCRRSRHRVHGCLPRL